MFYSRVQPKKPQPRMGGMRPAARSPVGPLHTDIPPLRSWWLLWLDAAINMALLRSWHRTALALERG
jgi:hypothetical protein